MIKKVKKTVQIKDFIRFWELVRRGDFAQLYPDLAEDIKKIWLEELKSMFKESKELGSYGEITMETLKTYAKDFLPPIKNKRYIWKGDPKKSGLNAYLKRYPYTYKKTGDLEKKITRAGFDEEYGKNGLKVKALIPLKNQDIDGKVSPLTYRFLETRRSFLKASFLRAWPKIFSRIMDRL